MDERYDVPDTARLNKFIRAIDSAFMFVKTLEGIKTGKYLIIIFVYCNWVVTRWQWLLYVYTKREIGYY